MLVTRVGFESEQFNSKYHAAVVFIIPTERKTGVMKGEIVKVPNPDKVGHHDDAKHPGLYPPHPSRVIFSGRSGCGKGVAAKHLPARALPPFDRIVVYHYDTETLEWLDYEPSDIIAELLCHSSVTARLRRF
jgi:hypothetical protein